MVWSAAEMNRPFQGNGFERTVYCPSVVFEAGAKAFWLQLDLRSPEARAICEEGGIELSPKLADELLNQYVVTYGRPESLIPPEKLEVRVKKPGLTARSRTRLAPAR